jgi:protein-disulfide isomerase
MRRKSLLLGILFLCAIALGVISYLYFTVPSVETVLPERSTERPNVTLVKDDRTIGDSQAPILIVEYAALTCPHCAHFNDEIFPALKAKYIDAGKVYYVFRVFPRMSLDLAGEALARCVPAGDYFKIVDLLFKNQLDWDPEYEPLNAHDGMLKVARMAGMDSKRADRCMQDKAQLARANRVGQDGETRYGISGTPTFVINGKVHPGQYEWEDLRRDLDALLVKP